MYHVIFFSAGSAKNDFATSIRGPRSSGPIG